MKKSLLIFLFIASSLAFIDQGNEIQVSKKVKPLLLEYTSTGCPGCGSWGNPTFNNLSKIYKNEVTSLAVHIKYGDPMITAISKELAANRTGRVYTPQIAVNRENGVVITGGINHQESMKKLDQLIRKYQLESAPYLGGKLTKKEREMDLDYVVDFSDYTDNSELFIAVYLVEDGINSKQAGVDEKKIVHNHVIKDALNGAFGSKLDLKQVDDQKQIQFNGKFDFKKSKTNPEEASVVLVIWEKKEDGFYPINSLEIDAL